MKILYIALCDLMDVGQAGVKKKIENQLKAFKKDYDTYLITYKNCFLCIYHEDQLMNKRVLLTLEDIYHEITNIIIENNINNVYIRYMRTNYWMIRMLQRLKKAGVKVIIEFPTFPYDIELKGNAELEEDILYRNKLKKYVNQTTNYNGLNSIFGIPSIPIHNGIHIEDLPLKKVSLSEDITIIAVATMSYWHGYDRLIKGIANYYSNKNINKNVKLVLIGSGNETSKYRNIVKEHQLEQYVLIKGAMYGEDLDYEFDQADIAVGVLGQYRKNANEASPIKTKEYCARGIPIVLGHRDLAFEEKLPFIYQAPNDDTDIDIEEIINFYQQCIVTCTGSSIRQYAEKNLTWDIILEPIKKYFSKGEF